MNINNNMNQTNFGMALKINKAQAKGVKKFLETQGQKEMENLQKAGENMKNYAHYDMEVGEKGYTIVPKGWLDQGYTGYMTIGQNPYYKDFIDIKATATDFAEKGKEVTRSVDVSKLDVNVEDLLAKGRQPSLSGRYAVATELLEKDAARKAAEQAATQAKQDAISAQADGLISQFGVDA